MLRFLFAAFCLWAPSVGAQQFIAVPVACSFGYPIGDGCGVSPGLYYAPAVNSTTAPTSAQWGSYARQSGQTWDADHPQPFNIAGVDYGVGPNVLISTLTDIASWPAGQSQCTYNSTGAGTGITGWPAGWPLLLCVGATQADFSISGYNFGPTAYQGNPVGSHDCVNLVFKATNGTTYLPNITVSGNAFINGATCAPLISGVRYGLISAELVLKANLKIWNNYVDGRAADTSCCLVPTNQGFWISTASFEANLDVQYNYVTNIPVVAMLSNFAAGNESTYPCSNGTAYTSAGYVVTNSHNYYDRFGQVFGAGHWEIQTMNSTGIICARYTQYNTVVWSGATAADGASTFFHLTANNGTIELSALDHNTIVTNLVAGKTYPDRYEYYNWHTDAGAPNHIVIDGVGSSCAGLIGWTCSGPVRGQNITGGTNNTFSSVIGLQDNTGSGPITGSAWNGGCSQQDNASGLCPTSGNFPSLASSVSIPTNYPVSTVNNSFFNNRLVGEAGAQADHGVTTMGLFGYGVLNWTGNYIDGGGSGSSANATPQYWSANPAITSGGFQSGGGGGCAVAGTVSGNVELRTGGAGTYPQVNQFTTHSGGC